MKKIIFLAVIIGLNLGSLTVAFADGVQKHDGFFLRLAPGVGYAKLSEKFNGNKFEADGTSGLFNFAIGGAISENLILHFDASGVATDNPDVKLNGTSSSTNNTTMSTSLAGLGLTYYFPSNMYLTGSIGVAESKFEVNGQEYKTDKGFGINLMVGKEWWVSDNWGLGVAGQFLYTNCPDKDVLGGKPDVEASSIGILFSATYN